MKRWVIGSTISSLSLIVLIWIPFTRLFLIGVERADVWISLLAVLDIGLSIYTLQEKVTWFRVFNLIIGLSPAIFVILAVLLYWLYPTA